MRLLLGNTYIRETAEIFVYAVLLQTSASRTVTNLVVQVKTVPNAADSNRSKDCNRSSVYDMCVCACVRACELGPICDFYA